MLVLDVNMEILKRFNERVNRLEKSKFVEWTSTPRQEPQDNVALSEDWLALRGLHKDEFDGFVLNFRFLIQDRDGFSVRRVKEFYEKLPSIFDEEKDQFDKIYRSLKDYLSQRSLIQIQNKNLSNQDFFEIIFYGGLAHENADKIDSFMTLTHGIINGIVFYSFSNVLFGYLKHFIIIRDLNENVIRKAER
jgi:hypothetical protein